MDSEVSLLLERAENELLIARTLKKLSEDESNAASLEIPSGSTFYSSVIAHSYYAIFYSAKAYLVRISLFRIFWKTLRKRQQAINRRSAKHLSPKALII